MRNALMLDDGSSEMATAGLSYNGSGSVELWGRLLAEARAVCAEESALSMFVTELVLSKADFFAALSHLLARKLADAVMPLTAWERVLEDARAEATDVSGIAQEDLAAIIAQDPAAECVLIPFLCYKGFHALECHRLGHGLWSTGRRTAARLLQSRVAEVFGIDIHPAVRMGRRVFIDHGSGIVIGETASIGNDVSILQNVTLGGTGKERGDRHPKVHDGVLLSVGATVLGNIAVGRGATVGAGSVVLRDVPPEATAVGVPARTIESR